MPSDRVLRCIVFLAGGDLERLEEMVALSQIDARDVIVMAEYDRDVRTRLRDLRRPFDTGTNPPRS
jgi:hypothetical protein